LIIGGENYIKVVDILGSFENSQFWQVMCLVTLQAHNYRIWILIQKYSKEKLIMFEKSFPRLNHMLYSKVI
jgi:hypothetical protein